MKTILSSRRNHRTKRVGIFLITVALIVGIVGCNGSCSSVPVQYDLTASNSEGGEVIISGEGTYADGQIVTIEAVADECYEFVNWTGADVADPYSPITTVTMDEAKSITAVFALLSYELTAGSTGGGAVTSPGEDTFTYDCGTEVALVAEAEVGYYFVNWSGDVDTIANVNAYTTTITIMGDYSITANFELIPPGQFVLTTSSTAGGSVTTPGEGTSPYDEGTVVDLVAVADECYDFVNWTGDVDTIADVYSASTNITMDADKNVTANFALLSYNLTVDSTDGGNVTAPGEDTFPYDCGTVVNLVAAAELGYHFVEWSGDIGTIVDIDAAETTITMNGHYSITANFNLFAGGNGTAGDPYQLADWYNLDNVRNYLSSYFILTNDLDFSSIGYTELASATANGGKGWEPIGTVTYPFAGSFDGQGYEISNLFIDRPDENQVGLFGVLDVVGVIENVGVVNGNVTGKDDVGGLVGKNEGTASNSYSTGSVIGNNRVGGLVGRNEGTVSDSYSTGSVTGHDDVGGLVGKNEGTASDAYSTGSVTGNNHVGGLVGKNSDAVSNSYATGSVIGHDYVGGLVGKNEGPASNSYSTGNVTGYDYVGGLVGKNLDTVSNSYSTGNVTGNGDVGGLVGENDEGTVSNSFWDTQTSGQGSSAGGTGKTTTAMMDIRTFNDPDWSEGLEDAWDIIGVANPSIRNPSYIWNIVDDETYPFLSWQPV